MNPMPYTVTKITVVTVKRITLGRGTARSAGLEETDKSNTFYLDYWHRFLAQVGSIKPDFLSKRQQIKNHPQDFCIIRKLLW
uniref:Uncharacterized protein n=1 Tax=Pyxicephalus adspersus TaxID=30357 RepID=A0AAV3A8L1_PYXAD|nr:TPA: hypothetical protein GDO54_008029 [Pyxicephalus adspersus]